MTDWVVCSDFDGTICIPDSSEYLLQVFASSEWKELDKAVWAGRMTERDAFQKQISLLRLDWNEARAALKSGVRIREGFQDFVEWCRARNVPFTILSSGLRPLIDELLTTADVTGLQIESHDVRMDPRGWKLMLHPGPRLADHCSNCKCAFLSGQHGAGRRVIYIGDGYTDICPARFADLLFAADRLADELDRIHVPYHRFTTFQDIERALETVLPPTTQESPQ
jgi:2-hydroxy-3-keto-5-methylthiopentenyl-1-phosphate phosphatase